MPNTLKKGCILFIITVLLCTVSYFYVDRAYALFAYQQQWNQYTILKRFTQIIELLEYTILPFYLYFMIRFFYQKVQAVDQKLLAIANSLALTYFLKDQIKWVFGRYWPLTWTHHNPSLIEHQAYGFHFFKSGIWYQSFPSGHTAVTFAAMTALWLVFPKLRWLAVTLCLLTVIGQLGMDYHFVSDVIAGAALGLMVGYSTVTVMNKNLSSQSLG